MIRYFLQLLYFQFSAHTVAVLFRWCVLGRTTPLKTSLQFLKFHILLPFQIEGFVSSINSQVKYVCVFFLIVKKKVRRFGRQIDQRRMLGLKSVQQSQEIFQTHQRHAQKCWLSNLQNVCGCLVACLSRWKGANLIFLTGLRLAAMNVRHAWSKHILFIGLFLMCQEQTSSHQRLLTAGFHYYCTNTSLMICLSSAELWK